MNESYDLIILGGGAAGFAAAIKANELEAKTLLINSGLPLGGTCVNVGCVPSKNLLRVGEILYYSQHHNFSSVTIEGVKFDFQKAIEEELALVESLREEKYIKALKNLGFVEFKGGRAKFLSNNEIEVDEKKFSAEKFVISTGSTTAVPPIENIEEVGYLTHIEALKLRKLPQSFIVVGGGPLGLEFAQMFAHFGSKVTILQRASRILPKVEPEISEALTTYLKNEGIEVYTNVKVRSAEFKDGKKLLKTSVSGESKEFLSEEILLAAGKTPNSVDLGLENVGVDLNEKKAIKVDDTLQTSVSHIYAAGDVNDRPLRIETTAGREGTLSAQNALTKETKKMNYLEVPYAVFTSPRVAGVGLTDAEAIKRGIKCACRTVSFDQIPKALTIKDVRGLIKMVVDAETKKIIGVHILSSEAADLIHEGTLAVKFGLTLDDIIETIHVFPTLSESMKLVAQSFTKDIRNLSCCI